MGSLVEVIAKALVTKPDEVLVTEETDGRDIIVKLKRKRHNCQAQGS